MTLRVAVVCEARADQQTGCGLADRVLLAEVDWLEPEWLHDSRAWQRFSPSDSHLSWTEAKRQAKSLKVKAHGKFADQPGTDDAQATRRVLLVLQTSDNPPEAVILLRDDDGRSQRRAGMLQAVRESTFAGSIVLGVAHTMRESWVLAGFSPENDRERSRLQQLTEELGFSPIEKAERLRAKGEQEARHPKLVLKELTNNDWDRQARCWQDADLEVLKQRGQATGLADYLDEVARKLAGPLTGAGP